MKQNFNKMKGEKIKILVNKFENFNHSLEIHYFCGRMN
ncbi:MAG: hypothetical protein BWX51_00821 [Bacteroidetes bacterium ADurb.Bin012]|jgi:hypothetical protein|nr:MAG: hypothetical protein BWX51_00821 [Bacteroidetes bacterium ADurb.Bin012]